MSEILTIFQGIGFVLLPISLLYLLGGFFIGIVFGALPGLTSALAIALLLPMTYSMPLQQALIMCMGVYMAGIYSGSITAVTINIPGAPASAMTCIEGHALMQQGRGAQAIGHATIASAIGGSIGALLLIFVSPLTVELALKVRTPGKFSLCLFALATMVVISKDKRKGLITLAFGLMCATIGIDKLKAVSRFTFGFPQLVEGIDETTLIVGAFAVSEFISQVKVSNKEYKELSDQANRVKFTRRDFFDIWDDMKEIGIWLYIKSALIGYFIGVLPGAGASMAGFVAYAEAQRTAKHPEKFGHGEPRGIAGPETANNAVCGGALVPMLSLGIPGDGTTAILLGVFLVYGIVPGPDLLSNQLATFAPMYVALLISAAILLPLSLFLFGPYYLKIVKINRLVLYSAIGAIALIGVYAATSSAVQMFLAVLVGIVMYFFKTQGYPNVPFILGVILGPIAEEYLRTTLTLGHGNPMIFFTEPDSLVFLVLTVVFAVFLPRLNKKSSASVEKTTGIKDEDD